ncbi:MAG: hypothetical protein JWM37_236 [Candidatus Saccharibacteria bacterium]|nr:hypothetical protein [Candidatus Saccharibacteria bacterium]
MDFLDPKKQRARTVQLYVGYALVALAIIVATIILLYQAYGFGLDRNGQLIQNGLVYFSSQPGGADIIINGKKDGATNSRLNLPAGNYQISLKRDGYRDWNRNITIEGGQVARYDYPLLVPTTLQTTSKHTFAKTPLLATESPSRRWLLVANLPDGTATGLRFTQYDLQNPKDPATTFVLPNNVANVTSESSGFSIVDWSNDNRHLLLKYNDRFIMLDRNDPSQSFDLTARLGTTVGDIRLQDKKFDAYFLYDAAAQTVSSATLNDPTPKSLAQSVLAFNTYGADVVLYATSAGAVEGKSNIVLLQDGSTHYIRSVPAGSQYLLDLTRYDGDWIVAAGAANEDKVYVYRNPLDALKNNPRQILVPVSVLKASDPNYLAFSANTRFIMTSSGVSFGVYDALTDKSYHFTAAGGLDAPQSHARWMDGNRLIYVSGGKVQIVDFDNSNPQTLVTADSRYQPFFDDNYNNMYTLTVAGDGKTTLHTTSLLTPADQ